MVIQVFRVSVASTIATALAWLLVSTPVAGQEGGGGGPAGFRAAPVAGCPQISRLFWPCAKAKAATFNPPRNPDGTPNMNGAWNPITANGSQNIEDFAGDAFLGRQISIIVDPPDGKVPYLPQWANKRQDNWDHYIDPIGSCFYTGVPRQVYGPRGQAFIQAPGLFAIVSEFAHQYRTIPTDNSPHIGDSLRLYMGDSRGRWEGNTLVVDTTNLTDRTWLSISGHFHSEALHVTERFTLIDPDVILYETTLVDPKVFRQPWTMAMPLVRFEKGHEVWEEPCFESDHDLPLLLQEHKLWFGLTPPR
jgi:hypothetical protein